MKCTKGNVDLDFFWYTNFWTFGFQTPPKTLGVSVCLGNAHGPLVLRPLANRFPQSGLSRPPCPRPCLSRPPPRNRPNAAACPPPPLLPPPPPTFCPETRPPSMSPDPLCDAPTAVTHREGPALRRACAPRHRPWASPPPVSPPVRGLVQPSGPAPASRDPTPAGGAGGRGSRLCSDVCMRLSMDPCALLSRGASAQTPMTGIPDTLKCCQEKTVSPLFVRGRPVLKIPNDSAQAIA